MVYLSYKGYLKGCSCLFGGVCFLGDFLFQFPDFVCRQLIVIYDNSFPIDDSLFCNYVPQFQVFLYEEVVQFGLRLCFECLQVGSFEVASHHGTIHFVCPLYALPWQSCLAGCRLILRYSTVGWSVLACLFVIVLVELIVPATSLTVTSLVRGGSIYVLYVYKLYHGVIYHRTTDQSVVTRSRKNIFAHCIEHRLIISGKDP